MGDVLRFPSLVIMIVGEVRKLDTTTLSNEELVALCRSGGESAGAAARDQLVSNFSGMVQSIVKTYTPVGILGRDDLAQDGFLGLLRAIGTYDPGKASFSTHAHRAIRHEISRSIANSSRTVRVPHNLHNKSMRSEREGDYRVDHAHVPFEDAEEMGMLEWGSGRRIPAHPACE